MSELITKELEKALEETPEESSEETLEEISEIAENLTEESEGESICEEESDGEAQDTAESLSAEEDELSAAKENILSLQGEIERLRGEIARLEELKRAQNRILAEIGDFVALFPDTPIENIPDTVWESVKLGTPLAAAYALYEKRMVAEAKRIAEINAKNAKRSPGAAGKDTAGEYFSPEDVRRMSRAEVHANYSKIKDSMKKWM